jgi:hypothetical protein
VQIITFKMNNVYHSIFLFNPTCEYAVANGSPNWQPNRLLQKMEADLSVLPLFFAGKNDFVLVDQMPTKEFIQSLKHIMIEIPGFILKNETNNNQQFLQLPKNKLIPWGWSPAAHQNLLPLKQSCSVEFRQSPVYHWNPEHREITSRKFAIDILNKVCTSINADYLIPTEHTPKICNTQNDFENAIRQWGKIMVKAPWSSSGRGLQPITKTPVHQKVWEKVMGIVKDQGYAIAEPYLNRVLDLAFLFELKKGKVEFLGFSNFCTNQKGQYEGNYINGLPLNTKNEIVEFANTVEREIREPLIKAIETTKMAVFYEGVFGVDTLIYTDSAGKLRINPCLEINVRHTMGMLSLQLEKLVKPGTKGMFRTFYQPGVSFYTFKKEMEKKYPSKISDGKIESGFFAITEATEDTLFGAYILV